MTTATVENNSKPVELLGWVGSSMLALCGLPEAYSAIVTGITGLGWAFLLLWLFGEIFALLYVVIKSKNVKLLPLLFNYGTNLTIVSVILYVKVQSEILI